MLPKVGTGPLLSYYVNSEVTFLSNDATDRYFLFTGPVTEVNLLVRYSITFCCSVTSLLGYSVNPFIVLLFC